MRELLLDQTNCCEMETESYSEGVLELLCRLQGTVRVAENQGVSCNLVDQLMELAVKWMEEQPEAKARFCMAKKFQELKTNVYLGNRSLSLIMVSFLIDQCIQHMKTTKVKAAVEYIQ